MAFILFVGTVTTGCTLSVGIVPTASLSLFIFCFLFAPFLEVLITMGFKLVLMMKPLQQNDPPLISSVFKSFQIS